MRLIERIADEVRAMTLREAAREVRRAFRDHDLMTFAGAIGFHVVFAAIPLTLCGLALLGGLGLEEQWTTEWAPQARQSLTPPSFELLDETVTQVLSERQLFWATFGAMLAIWRVSAAMRRVIDVFTRIYGGGRERTRAERGRDSVLLGSGVAALLLAAAGCVLLGDDALRSLGVGGGALAWLRWPFGLGCLFAVFALLIAHAPAEDPPAHWVTFGSIVVVATWAIASLALGWYLTAIADYGSIFGALASVMIVLAYVYVASIAFLVGAQLDALVRDRVRAAS